MNADDSADGAADTYDQHLAESRAIDAMPGCQALAYIATVERINAILAGNISEFARLLKRVNDDIEVWLRTFDQAHPERHEAFLGECERLLHNALSAIHSRVDLLRAFIKRYIEADYPELFTEYNARLDSEFRVNPLHKFLTELRNYMLHHRLPVAQSEQSFWRGDDGSTAFEVKLMLVAKPLLDETKDFSSATRQWVSTLGDRVNILDLLDQYHSTVRTFDSWLVGAIQQHFAQDIIAYQARAQAFNQKWYSWTGLV